MKKLTYYIVTNNDNDINKRLYYSICSSKKECEEFIDTYLILENIDHYLSWCNLREVNPKDDSNWKVYKKALELENKFLVIKVKNTMNNILAIVRKSMRCPLIGCSYETDFERDE